MFYKFKHKPRKKKVKIAYKMKKYNSQVEPLSNTTNINFFLSNNYYKANVSNIYLKYIYSTSA